MDHVGSGPRLGSDGEKMGFCFGDLILGVTGEIHSGWDRWVCGPEHPKN